LSVAAAISLAAALVAARRRATDTAAFDAPLAVQRPTA